MTRQVASRLAWSVVAVGLGLLGVGGALGALGGAFDAEATLVVPALVLFCVSGIVGAVVAGRRPENPIGWLFCGFVAFFGLSGLAAGYADFATGESAGAVAQAAAWFSGWTFVALFALLIFVVLLFPDGRLLSPRWRVVAWTGGVGLVALAAGVALQPGRLPDHPAVTNPVGLSGRIPGLLEAAGGLLTLAAIVSAVASIVVRYRRSGGIARQQIKWLAVGALGAVAGFVVGGVAVGTLVGEDAGNALTTLGIALIPIGVGLGMVRYRLYDVDRVVSKTLVYGALTAILGGAYVALVLAGQSASSSIAGGSDLAIAASTLVVAALFLPVRARVQRFVDRRFYRRRYDAQRTLEGFGARLREQIDLSTLETDLQDVVSETMQPAHASLWLRAGAR